jgi:hypothetical protein
MEDPMPNGRRIATRVAQMLAPLDPQRIQGALSGVQ